METFDHVVVGGGVVGASIAYHLACKGAGKTLLLERNDLASAASSRAAGLVLQSSTKWSKTPLAKLTVDTIPVLEEELGEKAGYHKVGSLRIAASEDRVAELDAMTRDASKWDIPVEWPSATEVGMMVPWLDTSTVLKTAFLPTDGYIDPYLLAMFYIRAARARGAVVRPRTHVRDVVMRNSKVVGVVTDTGQIACGTVVDACGAWAAVFSQQVGFPLPMAPVRSHYWFTEPSETYGGEHPVTILPDVAAYTRPEVGGLILGVQEPLSATFDARELPDDPAVFSPTRGEEHWDILADAYEGLGAFFPAIENAQFSSYMCGLSSYTPDGEIILGPVPGVSGFYAAAGACGSGITLSAGMGDAIADLVLGRQPAFDVSPFRPDRFGYVDPFGEPFRERCAAARASKSRKDV
ncbi:NAD(P)/FAD-dependent oxidoreductase [Roseovarius sp. 2305UL8-3]|uniref:NAD(P)/FAD-dependent oxidoreductase n=1 Tax=Roseovarius conchicola TaxID=3121636 RepID=UPI0035297B1B